MSEKIIKKEEKKEEAFFKIDVGAEIPKLPDIEDKKNVDVKYPLIPPYCYAHIKWDAENNELVYLIEEPELTDREKKILDVLEEGVKELINLSFISVKEKTTVVLYLEKNVKVLLNELSINVTSETFLKLMYYLYRDFVGLNELEPLMNDYYIEDVECNGVNTPLYVVHRKYRNIRTSLVYPSIERLTSFVEKIAQKCGKYISYSSPLLDGALPDGSRVQATYTQEISARGPNFTVRKFTKTPWSPIQLIQKGTCSPEIYAYLWILTEYERSLMVIGATGTGKTSFLNTLAFFIPPQARIVSIEDTKELNLEHENWLPSVARAGIGLATITGQKMGEVTLFDLLKESFRQRPDYVIIGEVRGAEAFVLFQGMASIRGNEEIFIIKDKKPLKIKISELDSIKDCYAVTYDLDKKETKLLPINSLIKHPKRDILYKIITKTGREITITPDHSLFNFKNGIKVSQAKDFKIGDNIIIPARIPCGYSDLKYINLMEFLPNIRVYAPNLIKAAVSNITYEAANICCNVRSISDYYSNFKRSKPSSLKADKFISLMKKANIVYKPEDTLVKFDKKSKSLPALFKLSDEFLRLLGYYLSEGSLDIAYKSNRITLYNKNKEILQDMRYCIRTVTEKEPDERFIDRGFGTCTELSFSHKVIYEFLNKYCGKKYNKHIPDFIFGFRKERIGQFLSSIYAGDGHLGKDVFGYYTISKQLANDVSMLLLLFGIIARVNKRNRIGRKTIDYEVLFNSGYKKNEFQKYVKPISKTIDKIFVVKEDKNLIGDLYIDKIKSIELIKLDIKENVYDISIPGTHNFIGGFGGVLLHNSGHPSMGTMHADSVPTMVKRLETAPINLSPSLVETMDVVCVMIQSKIKGQEVRKLSQINEIIEVGEQGKVRINTPFMWDPRTDQFMFKAKSYTFSKIAMQYGMTEEKLYNEFKLRTLLLSRLLKNNISEFKQVQKIIYEYYKAPIDVLKRYKII